jgi:hypothetical protein
VERPGPAQPAARRLAALIERAARYQQRTVACLRAGRRPDGSLDRRALERAVAELSAAIACLREAGDLAEQDERAPLEATLRKREEERRSLESLLQRRST